MASACQKPADTAASAQAAADSARTAIDARNVAFAGHFKAGHADSLVGFYTADGTIMPPNMPEMKGSDAIRQGLTGMLSMGAPTDFTLRTTAVLPIMGGGVVEVGRYTWQMAGPNNAVMADSGKYMAHWVNDGGTWKMSHDIWNSDNPAPPAAPAPRRRS